jgi:hypothetical protein
VSDLGKGSVPETLLKPQIIRIYPIQFIYHTSSDMNTLILSVYVFKRGHAVAQVVMHCATSRKVAGSIPHGVTRIFH